MHMVDIIAKKRDGQALSKAEIDWCIAGFTAGDIPDYQAAAWLMAVLLRGMTSDEVVNLTLAMAHSGETLDLSDLTDYAVDKHSSGGVGDKTTLIVLPLVAACGVTAAKMSGRGLGLSGGTLDKLESIPGFNVNLDETEFRRLAKANGIVLAGQSVDLAPADGKLYALRDVTGTVPSLPLIVSSIMSKKIAAGAHGIVLDVKVGSGAFMKTLDEANALAAAMVEIGDAVGRDMIACVSDMNQPLGEAVGNTLEVVEALDTLRGGGPDDLREHCIAIAAHMLALAGRGRDWTEPDAVRTLLINKLDGGEALATFRKLVEAQGGDTSVIDQPERFTAASIIETHHAERDGWIARADAEAIARMAFELGAGREKKGAPLDHAVGVVLHRKVGEQVRAGDPLLTWHANDAARLARCKALLAEALEISAQPVKPLPLFYDVLYGERVKAR